MSAPAVTVLGIGNVLWADEGFGVRAVEELNRHYVFARNVRVIDGGTQGIYLVQYVRAAEVLLVFDAVDYGLAPGTLKLIEGEDVPSFMGAKKMSLHQSGFQEVLSMARLLGDYPEHILLVGVQPQELEDFGGSLRPVVRAQIGPAIEAALSWLTQRGIPYEVRGKPLAAHDGLNPQELGLAGYESGRPSKHQACRTGDERVLRDAHIAFDPKPSALDGLPLSVNVDHRRSE